MLTCTHACTRNGTYSKCQKGIIVVRYIPNEFSLPLARSLSLSPLRARARALSQHLWIHVSVPRGSAAHTAC
jgi:hypothetical protein